MAEVKQDIPPVVLEILARSWESDSGADLIMWLDVMMTKRYGLNVTHPGEREGGTEEMADWEYPQLLSFLQREVSSDGP